MPLLGDFIIWQNKRFLLFFVQQKISKDALGKLSFLHVLFLEHEVQINKNIYGMLVFMSKQVCLPKISSILTNEKWREKRYRPFLHKTPQ